MCSPFGPAYSLRGLPQGVSAPSSPAMAQAAPGLSPTAKAWLQEAQSLCRISQPLSEESERTLAKTLETIYAHLRAKALLLMAGAAGQPVLYGYMADGTPLRATSTIVRNEGTTRVVRKGRVLHEFLLQRAFLLTKSAGSGAEKLAVLLNEVLLMDEGKKAPHFFGAACRMWPLLRNPSLQHMGICIQGLCADRALFSSLDTLLRQRQAAFYEPELGPDLGDMAAELEATDWMVSTPCICHDLQNSCIWALGPHTSMKDQKTMYIVCESLRNSFAKLVEVMVDSVDQHLQMRIVSTNVQGAKQFWEALGVPEDRVEAFGSLDPLWDGVALWVNPCFPDVDQAKSEMCNLLFWAAKWRRFTNSRWLSLGQAARHLLITLLCGLEPWVALARAAPGGSLEYYLHGFDGLTPSIKRQFVITALCTYVPEKGLAMMLADDRLANYAGEVKAEMMGELSYVSTLPLDTWSRLSKVAGGMDQMEIFDNVVHGCHTAMAFCQDRFFQVVEEFPWKLVTDGQILQNIDNLASSDAPIRDPLTSKVRLLAQLDPPYPRERLAQALSLLLQWPWSTTLVEQGHASAAIIHKYHPSYKGEQIVARASLHQARLMLQQDAQIAKLEALEKRVEARRKRQQAFKHTGRQAFFKKLYQATKDALPPGQHMDQAMKQQVMEQHAQLYQELPPEAQDGYTAQASQAARTKDYDQALAAHQALEEIRAKKEKLQQKALQEAWQVKASSGRFSTQEIEAMAHRMQSPPISQPATLQELREKSTAVPVPPEAEVLDEWKKLPLYSAPAPDTSVPEWAKPLCYGRHIARGCVLAQGFEAGDHAFKLLYCMQNPLKAWFIRLVRSPEYQVLPKKAKTLQSYVKNHADWYQHCYTIANEQVYVPAHALPITHDSLLNTFVWEDPLSISLLVLTLSM